jgi:polyferredoxin
MFKTKTSLICTLIVAILLVAATGFACNGTEVILKDDLSSDDARFLKTKTGFDYIDWRGFEIKSRSEAKITPALAERIAEKFVRSQLSDNPPLPLTFRKLESVHGKLVYQFESKRVPDLDMGYHLGPVNFTVDKLVLDVDAKTGDIYLANGCGAAPGQLLYKFNSADFSPEDHISNKAYIPDNTNFIAVDTGREVNVDGVIDPEEWKDTGHRYFYLGNFVSHEKASQHNSVSYYAEVLTQVSGDNIYFAVRTDTPNWMAIMIKADANLGMLGAYKDAKLMRSDGDISDRHFTQRKDKSFFLAKDTFNHIIKGASRQDDLYTYEFSFPLSTGDSEDIELKRGMAYNMLLATGNTLEHYGLYTLDDAHKEHDHSKSNMEHANVWVSLETTFRVGSAADKDIFGVTVSPVVSGFTSGYDPQRSNTHLHYANMRMKDLPARASIAMGIGSSTVIIGFLITLFMTLRLRDLRKNNSPLKIISAPETHTSLNTADRGLFRFKPVRRFVRWKHFRTVFTVPTFFIFAAVVVLGFVDVQDARQNVATIYTWTLWWTLIIFSFIVLGRLWCMMCPFAAIGDLVQRVISFNKKLPGFLSNMWAQTLGFIVLTLMFTLMAFESKPFTTSIVILGILAATVIFSVLYERRSFCRHLCPIGAVIGLYSLVSPFEITPVSRASCKAHAEKSCEDACPMLESPQEKASQIYCNFCMKCMDACPKNNLTLKLRAPGKELTTLGTGAAASPTEAFASLFLLGVIIFETLSMTTAWQPVLDFTAALLPAAPDWLTFFIAFSSVIVLPIILFTVISRVLSLASGSESFSTWDIMKRFAFAFIPLGVSIHLAHNVQHLMIEAPVALPATMRLINTWIPSLLLPVNWNPMPMLGLSSIFFIQMGIIVMGLFFTLWVLYTMLKKLDITMKAVYSTAFAMALYAFTVIISASYLLGLPMNGRHIH